MLTNLDDADSRIAYSGSWQAYIGGSQSSRQWESSIHSTNQNGASATIIFIGTSVKVYCTVPSGSGTNSIAIITLDGQRVATVTRTTTSDPVYYDTWYFSGSLPNTQHTIVITNGGSSSDSPLQLDALDIEGDAIQASTPVVTPASSSKVTSNTPSGPTSTPQSNQSSTPSSGSSTTTSSGPRSSPSNSNSSSSNIITSAGSSSSSSLSLSAGTTATTGGSGAKVASGDKISMTTIFSVSTAADGSVSTQTIESPIQSSNQLSASSSPPVAAIVGAVIGGIVLFAIVLLLLCLRRRRRRQGQFLVLGNSTPGTVKKPTDVTPFTLEENNLGRAAPGVEPSATSVGDSARSEKAALAAAAAAAAEDPPSPTDEQVDLALRRWIERHPEILLNRTALTSTNPWQSPIDAGPSGSDPRRHADGPPEDFELGTMSSMYASTIAGGGSSSEPPPPAYQSSSKNRWSTSPTSPTTTFQSPPHAAIQCQL